MDGIIRTDFTDEILTVLNAFRAGFGQVELQNAMGEAVNEHVYTRRSTFDISAVPENSAEEEADEGARTAAAIATFQAFLADASNTENNECVLARTADATHCEASLLKSTFTIAYQNKYLEVPSQGPAIDGSLVVTGSTVVTGFRPVLCSVKYGGESSGEVLVGPWDFMLSVSEDGADNTAGSFTIPVRGMPADQLGQLVVCVYVSKIEGADAKVTALYDGEVSEEAKAAFFAAGITEAFIPAIAISIDATTAANEAEDRASASAAPVKGSRSSSPTTNSSRKPSSSAICQPIVSSIKLAADGDEMSDLRSQGYELTCLHINKDGNSEEQEGIWPFYVMAKYGNGEEGGVMAVDFVTVSKTLTPVAPAVEGEDGVDEESKEGSELPPAVEEKDGTMVENFIHLDLASADAANSVFLRVTSSLGGADSGTDASYFHRITMISAGKTKSAEDQEAEVSEEKGEFNPTEGVDILNTYISALTNAADGAAAVFSSAPQEVAVKVGFALNSCGLLLQSIPVDSTLNEMNISSAIEEFVGEDDDELAAVDFADGNEGGTRSHSPGGSPGGDGDDRSHMSHMTGSDAGSDDEDIGINEADLADQLEAKLAELEESLVALTVENGELQKKSVVLIARERASLQGQGGQKSQQKEQAQGEEDNEAANERTAEKERVLTETYASIVASRSKINQQTSDYDQLAHDLQTRLDDREYKANEISESFRAFKSEILAKAENTRTSKPLSKKLTKQFEVAQAKREEDLERVRLRNISMRTSLLRLERLLRSREQLAEGLHMIDFEQLKVENQTLYEKIEERTEELTKLNRKKTNTVQVLTHVREKLRFIEKTNMSLNKELSVVENDTMDKRGTLTGGKKSRDSVRDDNKELRRKQGFASSSGLLVDFEKRTKALGDAHANLKELQSKYNMLATQCARDEQFVQSMQGGQISGMPTPTARYGQSGPGSGNGMPSDGLNFVGGGGGGTKGLQPQTPYFPGAKPESGGNDEYVQLPPSH